MSALPVAVPMGGKPVTNIGGESDGLGPVIPGQVEDVETVEHRDTCGQPRQLRLSAASNIELLDLIDRGEIGTAEFDQPPSEQVAAVLTRYEPLALQRQAQVRGGRLR